MRRLFACWTLLLLAAAPQTTLGAFRPTFWADASSWLATDVVVVSTTAQDGVFEVLESWKGDLRAGSKVVVAGLIPPADGIPISGYLKLGFSALQGGVSEQTPRQPVGSRMVLFLKSSATGLSPEDVADHGEKTGWEPADAWGSWKVSAVWIDEGKLYCFFQPMNAGPSIVYPLYPDFIRPSSKPISYPLNPATEQELKERVKEVSLIQEEMASILAAPASEERAQLLKPYVLSDIYSARQLALKELGSSGPTAVATIRGMIDDPAFAERAADLIVAMAKAGGDSVAGDLNELLQQELAFWKTNGPSLRWGWWNQDATPSAPLRLRQEQTYRLIIALEQTRYPAARETAKQLIDLWNSEPQLDPGDQLGDECKKLMTPLPAR